VNLLDGAAHGFTHGVLDFGERLLDGVEIGAVGRQEEYPGPGGADRLPDGVALMAAKVVDDDDIARDQGLDELGLDIGVEGLGVDRAVDDPRRLDAIMAQRGEECHCSPMTIGRVPDQACAPRPPTAQGRHIGFHPGFIDKNQAPAVNPALILSPLLSAARDFWSFLLGGHQRFFYNSGARASKIGRRWCSEL